MNLGQVIWVTFFPGQTGLTGFITCPGLTGLTVQLEYLDHLVFRQCTVKIIIELFAIFISSI